MARIQVDIPTADGRSPGSLHVPDGAGPWPGVLFFPDGGGFREVVRTMADRLSAMGYVVLAPDVFYRAGQWGPFSMETVFSDKPQRARMNALLGGARGAVRHDPGLGRRRVRPAQETQRQAHQPVA
jgi:carboxymethylenebutenolidase